MQVSGLLLLEDCVFCNMRLQNLRASHVATKHQTQKAHLAEAYECQQDVKDDKISHLL